MKNTKLNNYQNNDELKLDDVPGTFQLDRKLKDLLSYKYKNLNKNQDCEPINHEHNEQIEGALYIANLFLDYEWE
ncbi:MAG: hypothetical protein U1E31_02025 [Rickettsiales bacterium]